jgi:hypothetical protein
MKTVVSFMAACVLLVVAWGAWMGCTAKEVAEADAIFNDADTACISAALAGSVIPAGTPVGIVAADVQVGCGLVEALVPDLEKVVASFEASQADAGTVPPAGAAYQPAPFVQAKKAAKKASPK